MICDEQGDENPVEKHFDFGMKINPELQAGNFSLESS
jgi:hypothetical protein